MSIPNKAIVALEMTSIFFTVEIKLWRNGTLKIVCVCTRIMWNKMTNQRLTHQQALLIKYSPLYYYAVFKIIKHAGHPMADNINCN